MNATLWTSEVRIDSIGTLRLAASDRGVVAVGFADWNDALLLGPWLAGGAHTVAESNPVLERFADELAAYATGKLRRFASTPDLRLLPAFTARILELTAAIPFAATASYGELAARAGSPRAMRAVGQAMRRNPAPILVPCHRVVAAGGRVGGFTPGLELKRRLMTIEGRADDYFAASR